MHDPMHIVQALSIKRAFGTFRAARYLRNRGYSMSQAVAVLARPVRVVVCCA